jgi:uncharacterized membrane protein
MSRLAAFGRGRWPRIALIASLILNGFLIGMIAADALHRPHGPRDRGPRIAGFELRRLADRLPREALQELQARLQPLSSEVEARVERIRAIRWDIDRIIAAPAPDRAALDARLAALRAENQGLQEEVQRATYDALLALPPEQRARLAEEPRRR